jgi:deoxyribodipyrimidine photo-lyase
MPSQVVLFRRDLRVSDHAALSGAMRAGITLGLIVLDPEILGATQFGMPRYSGHRVRFLLESIVSLRVALVELGVPLKVFVGSTCGALKEVFDEFPIAAIHIHDEPGTEEAAELLAIQRLARSGGVQVRTYKGDTLLSEADLPYPVTRLPEMFTTFRKDVERRWDIKPLIPIPSAQELPNIANLGDIPALESFGFTEPSVQRFKGGLYEARKRLQHYFWDADKLQYYKETRNGMLQDDDSSKLSPWLAVGAISAREIYYEVRKYEK